MNRLAATIQINGQYGNRKNTECCHNMIDIQPNPSYDSPYPKGNSHQREGRRHHLSQPVSLNFIDTQTSLSERERSGRKAAKRGRAALLPMRDIETGVHISGAIRLADTIGDVDEH
jgi:hypothetical protein